MVISAGVMAITKASILAPFYVLAAACLPARSAPRP
jgi:hypothetical protein